MNSNASLKNKKGSSITKNYSFIEKILPPSILSIITTIFYWPSLKYPFQFDDLANISKKFSIRVDNPISNWMNRGRWMSDWLNHLNYKIGRFDPFSYRLFNLMIHIITGLFVYFLIIELLNFLEKDSFAKKNKNLIAFVTSALFLLHPVQTQTVSYVIQARLEGLATMFIIGAILGFTKIFSSKTLFAKILSGTIFILFSIFSCGTKEIFVVLPFLIVLVDWFFICQNKWENFKKHFLVYSIFAVFFSFFAINYIDFNILKRSLMLQMTTCNNRGNILTHEAFDVITAGQFFISEFKVILHYFLMFIWPFNISVEYDWKLSEGFFASDSFLPFLALAAIISLAFYFLSKKKSIIFSFATFWFLLALSPRCTIIPSPELICDYKTYLASIGWLLFLATAIVFLFKFLIEKVKNIPTIMHNPNYQIAAIAILCLPLAFSTMQRNKVWSNSVEFWQDIVNKAPLKARGHNNLGVALAEANRVDEAIDHYKKAIELDKHYADPYSNIGVAYSVKGDIERGIAAFKAAINIHPNYPEAYNNIGTLFLRKKEYDQAINALEYAIRLRPYYGKAFYNLGRLYLEKQDEEKAWAYFKQATQGDLDTPEGFFTLGQMSLKLKKYPDAIQAFEQIIKRGVCNDQILFNLGNSYFMVQNYPQALNIYKKLSENNPLDSRYLYNLGETLFSTNNYDQALGIFKKILSLPQPIAQAHFRITACLERMNQTDQAKNYLQEIINSNNPQEFKNLAKQELTRITLQQKVDKGALKVGDVKNALNQLTNKS